MEHLSNFSDFSTNEHIYNKALSKDSKKWEENYNKFIKYLTHQIEQRQVKDFNQEGDLITFNIKGRKYQIDKKSKICLYKTSKGEEVKVELELNNNQLTDIINALKKPLKSPKAAEPSKNHPNGRKPYLD